MPCFMIGAGFGRCFGETMVLLFPTGINPNSNRTDFGFIPGAYAVAGAGAFAGMFFSVSLSLSYDPLVFVKLFRSIHSRSFYMTS